MWSANAFILDKSKTVSSGKELKVFSKPAFWNFGFLPNNKNLDYLFLRRKILDSSNLKEFANDNFDENGAKFSKKVGNTVEKGKKMLVTSNFSILQSVFKRLVLQTIKNQ